MAEYDAMLAVNLKGTVLCTGAMARVMMDQEPRTVAGRSGERSAGRGSIVNIASGNGYVAEAGKAPYTASKFAVIRVTKTAGMLSWRSSPFCAPLSPPDLRATTVGLTFPPCGSYRERASRDPRQCGLPRPQCTRR